METHCPSSSQQALCKDVEEGKEQNKRRLCGYQLGALALGLLFLSLGISVFCLKNMWSPSPGKVYDHQYKVLLDGAETDGVMHIDSARRIEIFKTGNGSDEVLEVHDFKNGLTGIRFGSHQKCYIRTQTKDLPTVVAELEADSAKTTVDEGVDVHMEDLKVWIPAEEPVVDRAFLIDSKIWEICRQLPIHWIHPLSATEEKFNDVEGAEESQSAEVRGHREARDVLDHQAVNDYREVGIELDNRLDDRGYCCQHCRRGYRYCQRYHEPLGGYWPYPYYYQGGRVICQIVMPCNWWIARMLGRV
ncbi:tenomodulin isoform X2 [Scleropages formosus]|uniref:Tenomodulin n=1 Tax=Scleropages formosus TaxID=113540 RepID=A0A8C9RDE8_SCLFO|nr:tenomodulin isoform X2 [Scleropages formosus]